MSTPEPHTCTLSPHSIVRAGQRWHIRAYCEETKDFRDFALARYTNLELINQPRIKNAEDDLAWITHVSIEIIAHLNLLESQQRMIRDEYFLGLTSRIEYCRGCIFH